MLENPLIMCTYNRFYTVKKNPPGSVARCRLWLLIKHICPDEVGPGHHKGRLPDSQANARDDALEQPRNAVLAVHLNTAHTQKIMTSANKSGVQHAYKREDLQHAQRRLPRRCAGLRLNAGNFKGMVPTCQRAPDNARRKLLLHRQLGLQTVKPAKFEC